MSGRGLGFTGGTVDKMESIPGYRTQLPEEEFIKNVKEIGISMISQTQNLAPADKKIYALRNSISCVESIPLIASSIMSKKIASGAQKNNVRSNLWKRRIHENKRRCKKISRTNGKNRKTSKQRNHIHINRHEPTIRIYNRKYTRNDRSN